MNLLHYFLHWYDGSIWGNLVASAIIALPGYLWGRFHVKRLHSKLDLIHKHLKENGAA